MANGQWLKAESLSNIVRWAFYFYVNFFLKKYLENKFFCTYFVILK